MADKDKFSLLNGGKDEADETDGERIDLNRHLIRNPLSTFYVRVNSSSMFGSVHVHHGDLLVVDRAVECVEGDLIIALHDDELTIKCFEAGAEVFGKVLHVIHSLDAGAPADESDEWPEVINE